jgi:uncharacterized membrane-anchored protein YjiN (DUF445 family)
MTNDDLMDKYLNALHELNHEKLRREAFERDLVAQKKMTEVFAKSSLDIGYEARDLGKEVARLKEKLAQAEATIGAQLVELDDLRAKLRQ